MLRISRAMNSDVNVDLWKDVLSRQKVEEIIDIT